MDPTHRDRSDERTTEASRTATDDAVFDALASAQRRFVLAHLSDREGSADLDSLAARLAAWDDDTDAREAKISLHHVHLPKLADAGLVSYDETVELGDDADAALAHLPSKVTVE